MFRAPTLIRLMTSAMVSALATGGTAWSQETAPAPALTLELNALQPSEKGCRITFVVTNTLGAGLGKAAFEIALFDEAGVVDRLTVLDFKELPAGKTKVSRFDLAGIDCGKIGRVLVNHATECSGSGIEPGACVRQLKTESRTGTRFGV